MEHRGAAARQALDRLEPALARCAHGLGVAGGHHVALAEGHDRAGRAIRRVSGSSPAATRSISARDTAVSSAGSPGTSPDGYSSGSNERCRSATHTSQKLAVRVHGRAGGPREAARPRGGRCPRDPKRRRRGHRRRDPLPRHLPEPARHRGDRADSPHGLRDAHVHRRPLQAASGGSTACAPTGTPGRSPTSRTTCAPRSTHFGRARSSRTHSIRGYVYEIEIGNCARSADRRNRVGGGGRLPGALTGDLRLGQSEVRTLEQLGGVRGLGRGTRRDPRWRSARSRRAPAVRRRGGCTRTGDRPAGACRSP